MKLAIFGGTFDPIHMGHLLVAETAREQFSLDQILFLPTGMPPHKQAPKASTAQRLAMVRRAVRGNPGFRVSAWEIQQKRPVYTYETLEHFKALYPAATILFILGSDSLRALPTWRRGPMLLQQERFLVAERKESPWMRIPQALKRRALKVQAPLIEISSHAIREYVSHRKSIRYQVPPSVEQYIRRHHLYQQGSR